MTAKEVVLSGGAPWGFRIHGGADSNLPLRIARVNPGSRASLSGLREGDVITSINGRPTNSMTNAAARALMQNPGPMLKLSLNEHGEMSIRRKSCSQEEVYRKQPMFNRVLDEQPTAHAPVYATVKSPLTYTLPPFHSVLKESTSVDKVSSSNETAPKIHISNPFYVPQNNQPEGLDRSHVSLNLDRHKTYETPLVSDNAKNITIPSYSNNATQTNGFSSLPYEVNYLPNCKREDDGSLKSYNASPLISNKKKSNKNCENSYTKHKNYAYPFDTSNAFDFEKHINRDKNNANKENGKEVISINKHEICEIEEIKTYKKYVLSGETSFELGDTQTNGTGEPFDDPPILHNAYSSLSDSQLFKAKTFHTTQDESLNKERNTMPKQRASRDGLHRNASRTEWQKPGAPKSSEPSSVAPTLTATSIPIWRPGAPSPQPGAPQAPCAPPASAAAASPGAPPPPPPPLWTPGASPLSPRKGFKPVHFEESPPVRRKFDNCVSQLNGHQNGSESDSGLRSSRSAPAAGLNSLAPSSPSTRLPKIQNPTVTLLQKAREGASGRVSSAAQHERDAARLPRDRAEPPHAVHALRREYASADESSAGSHERSQRTMTLEPRKVDGIGPTTKEGMPVALRSEVTDPSRWYKKMYETIHKNKYDDDYVTVRYKSPREEVSPRAVSHRSQYAYFDPRSGYLSEPEGREGREARERRVTGERSCPYDSDVTPSRRRRTVSVQEQRTDDISPYLPNTKYSTLSSARVSHGAYRNQPGRIEDYVPGKSSVVDKEAKQWWDEVMDIFDGQLSNPPHPQPQAEPKEKMDLTTSILAKSNMAKALKESGYDSDSVVFRRREDGGGALSPAERRAAYRDVQAGGEPPLRGFRSPAPHKPDETEIEYIPLSTTLTKIRVHKTAPLRRQEVICYPVTNIVTDFEANYRKSLPSFISVNVPSKSTTGPPAPPRRVSSKKSKTLNLVTSSNPTTSLSKRTLLSQSQSNVDFLKEKIAHKLSRQSTQILSSGRTPLNTKTSNSRIAKSRAMSLSAPPAIKRSVYSETKNIRKANSPDLKKHGTSSFSSSRKTILPTDYTNPVYSKYHSTCSDSVVIEGGAGRRTPITNILDKVTSLDKLWSAEKRNEPLDRAKAKASLTKTLSGSKADLQGTPKAIPKQYSSRLVNRGRDMIRTAEKVMKNKSTFASSSPCLSSLSRSVSKPSTSDKTIIQIPQVQKRNSQIKCAAVTNLKKSRSSENSLKKSPVVTASRSKNFDKKIDLKITSKRSNRIEERSAEYFNNNLSCSEFGDMNTDSSSIRPISSTNGGREFRQARNAVISDSFFQHLFLGDDYYMQPFSGSEHFTGVLQKAQLFQKPQEFVSQRSINSYLLQRKPVSHSRFTIWDRCTSPVRSTSPRSVSWPGRMHDKLRKFHTSAKYEDFGSTSSLATTRSRSEPPDSKLYFSQTSRPKSPSIVFVKKHSTAKCKRNTISPSKLIFSQTSRPVSPMILNTATKTLTSRKKSPSPSKIVFSETVRPVTIMVPKSKSPKGDDPISFQPRRVKERNAIMYFSQTSRPVSPKVFKSYTSLSRSQSTSPVTLRSPSSRRIHTNRLQQPKCIMVRTRSEGDANKNLETNYSVDTRSDTNLQISDPEYADYITDMQNTKARSERFRELNTYYAYLERAAELEKATSSCDLRHRRKDEEIIDFDRWKKIRSIERAEEELNSLYYKLKRAQNEKDMLFFPRDLNDFRWNHDKDRGLRIKEKSVEDLKDHFQQLSCYDSSVDLDTSSSRDNYKPLWRGTSVAETAFNINRKNEKCEALVRELAMANENDYHHDSFTDLRKKIGLGNHLWSSLSIEQVDSLKKQLNAIYSKELESQFEKNIDSFAIDVRGIKKGNLQVRSNSLISVPSPKLPAQDVLSKSDSIASIPCPVESVKELKNNINKIQMGLSETEKRKISQTLSLEVLNKVKKIDDAPSLKEELDKNRIIFEKDNGTEIKSAVNENCSKATTIYENNSETLNNQRHIVYPIEKPNTAGNSSASETETASSDLSNKTVIYQGSDKVKKKVEYFESVKITNNPPKIIYIARESSDEKKTDSDNSNTSPQKEINQSSVIINRQIMQSQSCANLKELFGETEKNLFSSLPPKSKRSSRSTSPQSEVCVTDRIVRDTQGWSSEESIWRSRSPSPDVERYWRHFLKLARAGEVHRLARRFDSPDATLQRHRSDPELALTYESASCPRNTHRAVARVPLRPYNRYMPHIDIISKLATLRRRAAPRSKSAEEPLECRPGEVERIRRRFEVMSLLGQIYASEPDMTELHDIAPYLAGEWIAHRFPKRSDNNKRVDDVSKLVRDERSPIRRDVAGKWKRERSGPVKLSSILKSEWDPALHRVAARFTPGLVPPRPPAAAWPRALHLPRPLSVTFRESPRRYLESDVNIHYKSPVRRDQLPLVPERELAQQQADHMKRLYREQKRTKYLQELQDMQSRRHQDNFTPSQKAVVPLNRYDDADKVVAKALFSFNGQAARELTFRKGDVITVRRQVDQNWYEGELHGKIGLFPYNYVEIQRGDAARSPKPPTIIEGRARAKFDFTAQTNLELPMKKGDVVALTRRIDHNWWEGRLGHKTGIFPDNYVQILQEPSQSKNDVDSERVKPVASPAGHGLLSHSARTSMGSHSYTPQLNSPRLSNGPQPTQPLPSVSSKPAPESLKPADRGYGPPTTPGLDLNNTEPLYVDTNAEAIPFRVLYAYRPQHADELELRPGDTVYVLERCDDGWLVGSSQRSGRFGTFPGNYVERI